MTNESHRPHDDQRASEERKGREAAAREAAPKGKARQFRVPTTATHFGDSLDVPHPPDADAMIVCTWNGGGQCVGCQTGSRATTAARALRPMNDLDLAACDELLPRCHIPDVEKTEAQRMSDLRRAGMYFKPLLKEVHRLRALAWPLDPSDARMLLVWEAWAKKEGNEGAARLFRRVHDRLSPTAPEVGTPGLGELLDELIGEAVSCDSDGDKIAAARTAIEARFTTLEAQVRELAAAEDSFTEAGGWDLITALRSSLAQVEGQRDALAEEVRELRFIGGQLANIAFNVSQNDVLEPRTRETMNTCRKQWDAIVEKHVTARAVGEARTATLVEENRAMLEALADAYPGSRWADKLAALGSSGRGASPL